MTLLIEAPQYGFYTQAIGKYLGDDNQGCQGFTLTEPTFIEAIGVYLNRAGNAVPDVRIHLYAANANGTPTGGVLYAGVIGAISQGQGWTNIYPTRNKYPAGDYCIVGWNAAAADSQWWTWDSSFTDLDDPAYKSDDGGSIWSAYLPGGGVNTMSIRVYGEHALIEIDVADLIQIDTVRDQEVYPLTDNPSQGGSASGGNNWRIACVGDSSTHGGTIINHNADGTYHARGDDVAVNGASHSCPIIGHGITPITAATVKTNYNGKKVLTKDATAGCGAKIRPPDRSVYIE